MYDPEEAEHYAQMEYEQKPCEVTCESCRVQQIASEMVLRQAGWKLEFVPGFGALELCPDEAKYEATTI